MKTFLGIELGSTRIKSVLIDDSYTSIASGVFDWENHLDNGVWTYRLSEAWAGLKGSCNMLANDFQRNYGIPLETVDCIGISAMMHGYLVFDAAGNQLVPFRTWRNTITEQAAAKLSAEFSFNIPQRWSIAHLYQALLNGEPHVKDIAYITTLSGYIHWQLTGQKVLGIGDASGMFPITAGAYDPAMVHRFRELTGIDWNSIAPAILEAGEGAGFLREPFCTIPAGIPLCPPEGDAGTGMVATNSVAPCTGNVSAGTSIFFMAVLEKGLSKVYTEVDIVATPDGKPVAMIHCNNCTTDIDAWMKLFWEVLVTMGINSDKAVLYDRLYNKALEADPDCDGILSYNYFAGEHLTNLNEGRPLLTRMPDSNFTLANFMRALIYGAMATLKIGKDILTEQEHITLTRLLGHGGLFKTKGVAQKLMASALDVPIAVMKSAGEGGAWGIALLAAFAVKRSGHTLEFFLDSVFADDVSDFVKPDARETEGFAMYMRCYKAGLSVERTAVERLN